MVMCPSGHQNQPHQNFCGECGAALQPGKYAAEDLHAANARLEVGDRVQVATRGDEYSGKIGIVVGLAPANDDYDAYVDVGDGYATPFLRDELKTLIADPALGLPGEIATARGQATVAIECIRCGAGHCIVSEQTGYTCHVCGAQMFFRRCSRCKKVVQLDEVNTRSNRACPYCGVTINGRWGKAVARDQEEQLALSGHPQVADPNLRVVRGVVAVASGIPGITPGASCSVRFRSDRIEVVPLTRNGFGNAVAIEYADVDGLELSGPGAKTTTTDAGLIGGGFGLQGAAKGIALATLINALTRRRRTTIDTVVDLKAGPSEVLLRTHTFEPAVLHALLAPVYYRIQQAKELI